MCVPTAADGIVVQDTVEGTGNVLCNSLRYQPIQSIHVL